MAEPVQPTTGAILLSEQDELPPTGFFEEVDLSPHRLDQPEVPAAAVAVVALLALVIMWRKRHRCLGRGYQKTATATPPPTRGRATRARRQRSPSPEDDEEMGYSEEEEVVTPSCSEDDEVEEVDDEVEEVPAPLPEEPVVVPARKSKRQPKEIPPPPPPPEDDEVEAVEDPEVETVVEEPPPPPPPPPLPPPPKEKRRKGKKKIPAAYREVEEVEEVAAADDEGARLAARIAQLEAALAEATGAEQRATGLAPSACVGADGHVTFSGLPQPSAMQSNAANDDQMTMIGVSAMAQARETAPAFVDHQPRSEQEREADAESRQAKLEAVLRSKKEAAQRVRDAAVKAEMEAARDAMRDELQALDDEIESRQAAADEAGPAAQLAVGKWFVALVYSRFPPPAFDERRADEEVALANTLRFKEATTRALKLVQTRYGPEKNSAAEHGAEWAVTAEEVTKRAFALMHGISKVKETSTPAAMAKLE